LEFVESSGLSAYPIPRRHTLQATASPTIFVVAAQQKIREAGGVIEQRLKKPKEGFDVQKKAVQPKEGADSTEGRWDNP